LRQQRVGDCDLRLARQMRGSRFGIRERFPTREIVSKSQEVLIGQTDVSDDFIGRFFFIGRK